MHRPMWKGDPKQYTSVIQGEKVCSSRSTAEEMAQMGFELAWKVVIYVHDRRSYPRSSGLPNVRPNRLHSYMNVIHSHYSNCLLWYYSLLSLVLFLLQSFTTPRILSHRLKKYGFWGGFPLPSSVSALVDSYDTRAVFGWSTLKFPGTMTLNA